MFANASYETPFDKNFVKPSKFDVARALSIAKLDKIGS